MRPPLLHFQVFAFFRTTIGYTWGEAGKLIYNRHLLRVEVHRRRTIIFRKRKSISTNTPFVFASNIYIRMCSNQMSDKRRSIDDKKLRTIQSALFDDRFDSKLVLENMSIKYRSLQAVSETITKWNQLGCWSFFEIYTYTFISNFSNFVSFLARFRGF